MGLLTGDPQEALTGPLWCPVLIPTTGQGAHSGDTTGHASTFTWRVCDLGRGEWSEVLGHSLAGWPWWHSPLLPRILGRRLIGLTGGWLENTDCGHTRTAPSSGW